MSHICGLCRGNAIEDETVFCDLCKSLYQGTCAGLSRQETSRLKKRKSEVTIFCKDYNFVQIIKCLKEEVGSAMSKVAILEKKQENCCPNVYNGVINQGQELIGYEQVFKEFEDRCRRENNVAITNLPESVRNFQ